MIWIVFCQVLLLGYSPFVRAHSWVEQVSLVSAEGSLIGSPGFARGNVLRVPGSEVDLKMTYELPVPPLKSVTSFDNICQPSQANVDVINALQAPPLSNISLFYQENGHITKWYNQPKPNPGVIFLYGTLDSRPDDLFTNIHKVWNTDGTGGDGRGVLLAEQPFDDGRCYENNESRESIARQKQNPPSNNPFQFPNLWCATNVTLPSLSSGEILSLYWVWDWPGIDGHGMEQDQFYTTCMDIVII